MEFKSKKERGFVMRKIAEQRLEAAWMKAMTTMCGLEGMADPNAAGARDKLQAAMKLIHEAKWNIIDLPEETCAEFTNVKGGYETPEEIVRLYRHPKPNPALKQSD